MGVGRRPHPPKICTQSDPPPSEMRRLRPISAYNISAVRASKKVQLSRIGSRPRAFQRAVDEVRTLPLSPQKGGSKRMNIRRAAIYQMFLKCAVHAPLFEINVITVFNCEVGLTL